MPLTDSSIRAAKPNIKPDGTPTDKPYKLFDAGGLYLEVAPAGGKWWRLKYRHAGKEKRLSLGTYPETSLAEARIKRDEARKLLDAGTDPSEARKAETVARVLNAGNTFEVVALEWLDNRKGIVEPPQIAKALSRLNNDVFPWLGSRPIADLAAPEILLVLRRIDGRGARYTAHKVRSEISQICRYAIATGRATRDPARDLIGAIPPAKEKHFAAITEPAKVGEMLRAFDAFSGTFPVQCALKLAPMLFCRPGELRQAEWKDFDLDRAEWRYLVTKTNTPHLVPLARQAVAILRELHRLTGRGRYLFPGARDATRPMSDAAINAALRRLGFDTREEITGHGFRAMARTILHEELHVKPEVIEHQLAHRVPDTLGTAYNRTRFIKDRVVMMQLWGDYLDKLKVGADVIPLHGKQTA
jgi:integrase